MEELPPGFRFYPTEEELISFYLHHKLQGTRPDLDRVIPVVDIYSHEPWELPIMAGERGRGEHEEQWFFFTAQQEREARGGKPNRTTTTGYWKATGSPGYVFSTMHTKGIGVKKTMVFYKGRAPVGKKTHWKMNEYKAIDFGHDHTLEDASSSNAPAITKLRHEMSVCRVYITSGSSRAFDRRPSGSITSLREPHHEQPLRLQSDCHHHHHQLTNTTTTTTLSTGDANTNAPVLVVKSSSSTNSSRSGGDQTDHLLESNINNNDNDDDDDDEMITSGLQPLWEWEQLNWP